MDPGVNKSKCSLRPAAADFTGGAGRAGWVCLLGKVRRGALALALRSVRVRLGSRNQRDRV